MTSRLGTGTPLSFFNSVFFYQVLQSSVQPGLLSALSWQHPWIRLCSLISFHCPLCHIYSQCCGSGSGAFLTPGSGIRNRFFPDPQIPNPFFESFVPIFWAKSSIILWKLFQFFFLQHFKNKIIFYFVKFIATKQGMTTNFFHPSLFYAVFGSEIRDPGSGMGKNQDPG